MKQIPEDILNTVVSDTVGTLDGVDYITANENDLLTFHMKDGAAQDTEWYDRSRSDIWTEEMRATTGRKTKERNAKNGEI